MWRRLIAFVGHAPGLWLVYREQLAKSLRTPNLLAVLVTLAGMILAYVASVRPWLAVLATWPGHAAWGAVLALRLPAQARDSNHQAPRT